MLLAKTAVSIDIGSDSVKVAQLVQGRGGVRTIRFAEQALPAGYRWEVGGDRGPLAAAVKEALQRAGIRARSAVMSLPRRQVTARMGSFPPAERDELRRVVEYDLADHIPFPVDQVVVDFQRLGPSTDEPGLEEVLVVAAPRELVREYLRVAGDLKLKVEALTVDALGMEDLVARLGRDPVGLTVALEMGARATTINVSMGGRLRLTRSVAIGGRQLTRAIQEDLGVEPDEAERLQRSEGLRLLERQPRPTRVQAWLDNLQGEIRRSALSFGPGTISRVVLAGGAAAIPYLREFVREEFDVEPVVLSAAEAFQRSELSGEVDAADRCLLAMAGALQGLGRSQWTISLLLEEVLEARRGARRRWAALGAVAAAVLAMAAAYLLTARQIDRTQARVLALEARAESADRQQTRAQELESERARLKEQVDALEVVEVRRYAALELLRAISLYAPDEVVLTNFQLQRGRTLTLNGHAPTPKEVADLHGLLRKMRMVSRVELGRTRREQAGRGRPKSNEVSFTLDADLWIEPEARAQVAVATPWGAGR